jgi:hypothetical protein
VFDQEVIMKFGALLLGCALIALGGLGIAQKPAGVTVPAPHTSAASGKQM